MFSSFRGDFQGFGNDEFASPFYDRAAASMPTQLKQALQMCEFLWLSASTYRRAAERKVSYFLTDIELNTTDSTDPLNEDDRTRYKTFFDDVLDALSAINRADLDVEAYGNAFISLILPFRRLLACPQCGSHYPLREVAENATFKYRWTNFEWHAECPSCRTGSGYSGRFTPVDLPEDPETSLRLKHWNPHQLELIHDFYTDETAVIFRPAGDYKEQVRRGDLHVLEHAPLPLIRTIQRNALFRLNKGSIFHMHEPTLSGVYCRGWGIPRMLMNFRDIYYVETLRKQNLSVALDYVIPFRLLTPEARNVPGAGTRGMQLDPFLSLNLGDFSAQVMNMIRMRRRDPTRWNFLPFPIQYQALGGDAKNFAPRELMDQGVELMLNASGSPVQLYRGDLTLQTAPVALRLFEADNHALVHNNNAFLRWLVQQVGSLLSWPRVRASMKRVTHADDFQRTMVTLQMAMGGVVARTEALKLLGMEFKDQQRQIAEEARFEQEQQARVQEEMEQVAFGQSIAKGMPAGASGVPAVGGQAGGMVGGGAAPGGMPGMGPVTEMIQSGNTPQRMDEMLAQADSLASSLLALPESQRLSELRQLGQKNQAMHSLVKDKLQKMRSRARTAGGAMLMGQQPQAPQQ